MMQWRFPAAPESVPAARRAAREAGGRFGVDDGILAAMQLCVSEAVTNAVVHAYADHPPGDIEVEAVRPDDHVCVYVRDSGQGMRARADSPGAGFGLAVIRRLSSEVAMRANGESGTELMMRFELTTA